MSDAWHYNSNGESAGPMTFEQLRAMASSQKLRPADLVWKTGMPQWAPAGTIEGLFSAANRPDVPLAAAPSTEPIASADATPTDSPFATPTATPRAVPVAASVGPAIPVAPAGPSAIAYFSAASGIPPRAAEVLKGFAPATGERGDWPLSDFHMTQLKQTGKLRKKIRAAGMLYKSLFALSVIGFVFVALVTLFATSRRGPGPGALEFGTFCAVFLAFSLLYFFTWRATLKCHRWAPMVMMIVCGASIVLSFIPVVIASISGARVGTELIIGPVVGMILPAAFMVTSWRAYSAIPQFLTSPMWTQEVVVDLESLAAARSFFMTNK